ncbi:MAG: phosphate ABC transporter permease PstA [Pseudomonadota bacterium]
MQRADRLFSVAAAVVAALVAMVPLLILWQLLQAGAPMLGLDFLLQAPQEGGRAGGIASILLSTLWVLGVCLVFALPLGLGAALFLVESINAHGRLGRTLQLALDVLGGVPSIVFGLFGNRVFCVELGMGFSILSGGLTLACMVMPLFVRAAEQAMRACPISYRQGVAALALSRWGYVRRILLPYAAPGIAVGLVLAAGRALAETAVLLFTAGYVMRRPEGWMDSGRTLAVHIYDLSMNVTGGAAAASASALVLLALSLSIVAVAQGWTHRFQKGRS